MQRKLFFLSSFIFLTFGQVISQCNNTPQYPTGSYTPTTTYAFINTCNFGGEHALVNVTMGNIYYFSTQTSAGSNITYDSQLTLRDNSFNYIDYNDDAPDGGFGALIIWEATYTGIVQIHLNIFNCASNTTCSYIMCKYETPNSILEQEADNTLEFTMNPTSGNGIYSIDLVNSDNSSHQVNIYSMTGDLVYQLNTNTTSTNIDLSNLTTGIYVVSLVNEKGQKFSRKVSLTF